MFLRLWLLSIGFWPGALSAEEISFNQAQAFIDEMKSEKIFLPNRPPLFNHYYRSAKILSTAVVFLPGMGEAALKYYELGRELKQSPATIYMWDHIGQGSSSHLLATETTKVHIDSFETHLQALENFLISLKKKHKNIYVIAHSMGGHLALRLALRHPDLIEKLALSSPLIDLNYDTLPIRYVTWILNYLPGESYPPLYSYFKSTKKNGNYVTKSEARTKALEQLVTKYPEQKREGATIGWLRSALQSIDELKKTNPGTLKIPILMLQAEKDYLVSTSAQREYCKKISDCRTQLIPDSYHELLFEKDPARATTLESILKFFNFH